MLVLTRKKEEVIDIEVGGDIKISVKILNIAGNRVKLGVSAPRDIIIRRAEVKPNGSSEQNGSE